MARTWRETASRSEGDTERRWSTRHGLGFTGGHRRIRILVRLSGRVWLFQRKPVSCEVEGGGSEKSWQSRGSSRRGIQYSLYTTMAGIGGERECVCG